MGNCVDGRYGSYDRLGFGYVPAGVGAMVNTYLKTRTTMVLEMSTLMKMDYLFQNRVLTELSWYLRNTITTMVSGFE